MTLEKAQTMKKNEYWIKRNEKAQTVLFNKTVKETEAQLKRYYASAAKSAINNFEAVYDKVLAAQVMGEPITPADLYKLDKYWRVQAEAQKELTKLGNKQIKLLTNKFTETYKRGYSELALPSGLLGTVDIEKAAQLINSIWCADGKNWSQRIWNNTAKLQKALNDGLVDCVISGKKTSELKALLQEKFKTSYYSADMICRTELAHIQTQAAADRYKDSGLKYYEVVVSPDDRTCEVCGDFDGKRFLLSEMQEGINAPPFHPNCRDCIVPVIE